MMIEFFPFDLTAGDPKLGELQPLLVINQSFEKGTSFLTVEQLFGAGSVRPDATSLNFGGHLTGQKLSQPLARFMDIVCHKCETLFQRLATDLKRIGYLCERS